jgi:glycosyltransferase involved in cell wall biosynthesis
MSPIVSVLMPVFNGEKYIAEAINSLLQQSYTHWELIILDDGSADATPQIVQPFLADARVQYVRHAVNKGLAHIRNEAVSYAKGEFLAWLDSDDIAHPQRLASQVEYLVQNPKIALLGSWANYISPEKDFLLVTQPPTVPAKIHAMLLFTNCFVQSTIMIRSEVMQQFRYDARFPPAEDYDLWVKIAQQYPTANLPVALVDVRRYTTSTSQQRKTIARQHCCQIAQRQLQQIGIEATPKESALHIDIPHFLVPLNVENYQKIVDWLAKLQEAQTRIRYYDQKTFEELLYQFWLNTTLLALPLGWEGYRIALKSRFCRWDWWQKLKWGVKFLLFKHK